MRLPRFLLPCLLVLSGLLLPAFSQTIDYARLDARLNRLAAEEDIVGLSVAVIDRGEIAFARGYGVTELGGEPVTDETVFRWASLSKGVAATEVAILATEARLNLSDPVSKYATTLRLPNGGEAQATLEDVLSHRLGILPNAYDSIAEVIEEVTQSRYADAVEHSVFKPIGMVTASIGRAGLENASSWARPHTKRSRDAGPPRKKIVNDDYYRVPAAGGVNGSIRDLALYARAHMGLVPDVLSDTALEMLQAPRVYTRREQAGMSRRYRGTVRDARYALGWRVYKYGEPGYRVVGHRGAVEGYRSYILFDPERDTGVVILWNSSSRRPNGIGFEVMDMAYNLPFRDWMELDGQASAGSR